MNTPTTAPDLTARLKVYLIDALDPDDHHARTAAAELLDEIALALREAAEAQERRRATTTTTEPNT
jgi:Flp pilus assembly protein CpaB